MSIRLSDDQIINQATTAIKDADKYFKHFPKEESVDISYFVHDKPFKHIAKRKNISIDTVKINTIHEMIPIMHQVIDKKVIPSVKVQITCTDMKYLFVTFRFVKTELTPTSILRKHIQVANAIRQAKIPNVVARVKKESTIIRINTRKYLRVTDDHIYKLFVPKLEETKERKAQQLVAQAYLIARRILDD